MEVLNYDCWETIVKYASLHTLLRLRLCNKDFEELTCRPIAKIKSNVMVMRENLDKQNKDIVLHYCYSGDYKIDPVIYVSQDSITFRLHDLIELSEDDDTFKCNFEAYKEDMKMFHKNIKNFDKYLEKLLSHNGTIVGLEFYNEKKP
jgi:hypothetical protein